nr:hypothetical protein [Bacillaceae bacterium]
MKKRTPPRTGNRTGGAFMAAGMDRTDRAVFPRVTANGKAFPIFSPQALAPNEEMPFPDFRHQRKKKNERTRRFWVCAEKFPFSVLC